MPVSRDLAVDFASEVVQLYLDAQTTLIERTAASLRAGIDGDDWLNAKLSGLLDLEQSARRSLDVLEGDMRKTVAKKIKAAYEAGGQAASAELAQYLGQAASLAEVPQQAAIQRLVRSAVGRLGGTHLPILRSVMDAYREAIAAGGAGDVLTGVSTRRQATQRAWSRLLDQGITSFTDALGRRQNMASYAEMSMRTSVAQAAVEGHLDKLAANDLDLVIVSNSSQECELCRPWEGKILSRSGQTGTVLAENPATGEMMQVEIAGTIDEAVRAGLFHPNCRHSLSAYFPGLTEPPTNTADPAGDANRQRLRALERRVRRLETQRLGALDDAAAEHYAKLASKARADIKAHVSGDSNLMRKRERERPNLGLKQQAPRSTDRPPKKIATKRAATKRVAAKKTAAPPKVPHVPKHLKAPAPKKIAAPKPKPTKTPEQIAADYNAKVGNPAVVTGNRGSWFDQLKHDTGIDHPVPVRDFEIDGYMVKEAELFRIDGVSYLVEKRSKKMYASDKGTTGEMLTARSVVEQFQAVHKGLPGADDYQRGYAWLDGRNPADAYWEKKYQQPGFESLATAGDEGVRFWNRKYDIKGPLDHKSSADHEFGHNVSTAAKRRVPPLDDHSEAWEDAVAGETSKEPIAWVPGDLAWKRQIRFGRGSKGAAPKGCTEYGTSSEAENYAESMSLYLNGVIGTGQSRVNGPTINLYFRDIWPKRAALFDKLFPEVARKQKEAIALRPK